MMLVSVILPNYNHARFLATRIDSIINQTFKNFELIILDDASTDNSRDVIEFYRKNRHVKHIIFNSNNSGSTFFQWKKGIEVAIGEIIWIAESDDYCKYDFLEKMLPLFSDPEVCLSYSRSWDVDEMSNPIGLSYRQFEWKNYSFVKPGNQEVTEHLFLNCTIPNASAVLFRKNSYSPSLINPKLKLAGDWLFYVGILKNGKIAYNSLPLNYHRFHNRSVRTGQLKNLNTFKDRMSVLFYIKNNYQLSSLQYRESVHFQVGILLNSNEFQHFLSLNFIRTIVSVFAWDILGYFQLIIELIKKVLLKSKRL